MNSTSTGQLTWQERLLIDCSREVVEDLWRVDETTALLQERRITNCLQWAYLLMILMIGQSIRVGDMSDVCRRDFAWAANGLARSHPDITRAAVGVALREALR